MLALLFFPLSRNHSSGRGLGSPHVYKMEAHLLFRNNAAEFIRLAEAARTSEHKTFFIETAERWITLAEHADKCTHIEFVKVGSLCSLFSI